MRRRIFLPLLVLPLLALACDLETPAANNTIDLNIQNNTPVSLCEVYISPADTGDWGNNFLEEQGELAPKSSATFSVAAGSYDLLVRDCSPVSVYSLSGIHASLTVSIGADGQQPLTANNASGEEICYLYAAAPSSGAWGEDLLGKKESILAGDRRIFYLDAGMYDLRSDDCDRNPIAEADGVDLNQAFEWLVSPPG